ncbi:MAG: PIN domain-containing protein [bacterium]
MHAVFVDTSVWVDHLRRGEPLLQDFLSEGQVTTHPFVIGELACGNLSNRDELLALLSELPLVTIATNEEVMRLIERHKLNGKGLGWVDMNLLASALISRIPLWTRDHRLAAVAKKLGITELK